MRSKVKILLGTIAGVAVAIVLLVIAIPILIGYRFNYGDTGTCPDATPEFFEKAVRDHFARNNRGDVEFVPGSRYDPELSAIAIRKNGQEFFALVDCRGAVEFTGK